MGASELGALVGAALVIAAAAYLMRPGSSGALPRAPAAPTGFLTVVSQVVLE